MREEGRKGEREEVRKRGRGGWIEEERKGGRKGERMGKKVGMERISNKVSKILSELN